MTTKQVDQPVTNGDSNTSEGERAFLAFMERTMPQHLKAGAPLPTSWPGKETEFAEWKRKARTFYAEEALLEWLALISRGWRPSELVRGEPAQDGMLLPDGGVARKEGGVLRSQMQRAQDLLREAHPLNIEWQSTGGLHSDVLAISSGVDLGASRTQAVLTAVDQLVRSTKAAAVVQREQVQAGPVLRVFAPIEANGTDWAPGVYRITEQEAEGLQRWLAQMSAERQRVENPESIGLPSTWPPFSVEGAPAEQPGFGSWSS